MGKCEAETRGDADTCLRYIIEHHLTDAQLPRILERADEMGILDKTKYKTRHDLMNGLDEIDEAYKQAVLDAIREGKDYWAQ